MLEPVTFEFLENLGFLIDSSSRFAYLGDITVEKFFDEAMKLVPSRQHIPFLIENKLHFMYLLEKRGFPMDKLRKEALFSLQPKIEYQKNRLEKALNVLGFEKTVQSECDDSILFLREPFYQRKFIQVVQKKGFVSYLQAGYIVGFSKISDKDILTAEDLFEELKYTVKKQSERSFTDLEKMVLYAKIEEKEKQFYSMQ